MRQRPSIMIDIDRIEKITDRGIHVVLRANGKRVCFPKDDVDCLPGALVIPEWLARKMKQSKKKAG